VSGDKNRPESGPPEVRARQMGTKADPWRDGNGPAEESPAQPEAGWQEPIRAGQRPQGTSRHDAGHQDQAVSDEDASSLRDLGYRPSVNQVRHEPMPASHHAGEAPDQRPNEGPDRPRQESGEPGATEDPPAS
jgi:hypothetical protein